MVDPALHPDSPAKRRIGAPSAKRTRKSRREDATQSRTWFARVPGVDKASTRAMFSEGLGAAPFRPRHGGMARPEKSAGGLVSDSAFADVGLPTLDHSTARGTERLHGRRPTATRTRPRSEMPPNVEPGRPVCADSSRPVSANSGHYPRARRTGRIRPFAALSSRSYERARSARKRSSAEGVGCARGHSCWPGSSRPSPSPAIASSDSDGFG